VAAAGRVDRVCSAAVLFISAPVIDAEDVEWSLCSSSRVDDGSIDDILV